MRQLGEQLKALAIGNLTVHLDRDFPENYVQIKTDFNETVEKLKGLVESIVASTEAIASGTRQISSASGDLSRRTEQQAASLEQTAAALEEITITVKRSSAGAIHAHEIVAAADGNAKQSSIVVRKPSWRWIRSPNRRIRSARSSA